MFPYVAAPFSGFDDTHGGLNPKTRRVRTRLLIAGTAAASTAAVLALGGVFRSGGAAAARRPAARRRRRASCSAASPPATPRRRSPACRASCGCDPRDVEGARHARPRLPAARPRDRRRVVLRRRPTASCTRRSRVAAARPDRDRGPRPARALAPPVSPGARARPSRAVDLADDRRRLRRHRRRRASSSAATRRRSRAFDRMAALKPSVASYARVSYARELLGDTAGAARAMELASSAAVGEREAYAWTRVAARAARALDRATPPPRRATCASRSRSFPGYYVRARRRSRRSEAALGHLRTRASRSSAARSTRVPLPQYVGFLGDLERATRPPRGRGAAVRADRRDRAAARRERRPQRPRHRALRRRPRHRNPARASRSRARATLERPSIVGDDVLGWALARERPLRARRCPTRRARFGSARRTR